MLIVVALGWMYVALMMALAEATAPSGSVLGAVFTFVLYGVLPLWILLYILATPARRRAARAASAQPHQREHAAGDAVAPEREEP